MNQIVSLLLHNFSAQVWFLVPLTAIFLDLVFGVANAVKRRAFQVRLLGDFAHTNLLPYIGLLVINLLVPLLINGFSPAVYLSASVASQTLMGAFVLQQLASVAENVAELFGAPATTVEMLLRLALGRVFPKVLPPQPMSTQQFFGYGATPSQTVFPSAPSATAASASAAPTTFATSSGFNTTGEQANDSGAR